VTVDVFRHGFDVECMFIERNGAIEITGGLITLAQCKCGAYELSLHPIPGLERVRVLVVAKEAAPIEG
jgi:hypothetical protein